MTRIATALAAAAPAVAADLPDGAYGWMAERGREAFRIVQQRRDGESWIDAWSLSCERYEAAR